MRTVYLINLSFGLAGIERRFTNIWRTLRARGNFRPILVVPEPLAALLVKANLINPTEELLWSIPERPWARALSSVRLPAPGDSLLGFARARAMASAYHTVWERIKRDPSAIIHIGLNCSSLNPPEAPIVYECVDSTLTQLGTRHYIKAAARQSIIHCQTERIRQALEKTMVPRNPRWATVISPCYFANYDDTTRPVIERDRMLVAFVGRFSPEKNPLLFVEAIAHVRKNGLECRALMLGEGPLLPEIRLRIRQLGLESAINLGFTETPAVELAKAAIYVSLQTGDNYGSQSLLEAMGAGCAVVATDVGETGRLVSPAVGLLVAPIVDSIATAIAALLRNGRGTARLGLVASRLVRSQYTADAYVSFVESLYTQAVIYHNGERPHPATCGAPICGAHK